MMLKEFGYQTNIQGSPKTFPMKIKMGTRGPFHLILNLSRWWWQWHFGFWIFAPKCQPFSDCSSLKAPTPHFSFPFLSGIFLGHLVETSAATQLLHLSPVKADKGSQTPIRRTGSFFSIHPALSPQNSTDNLFYFLLVVCHIIED